MEYKIKHIQKIIELRISDMSEVKKHAAFYKFCKGKASSLIESELFYLQAVDELETVGTEATTVDFSPFVTFKFKRYALEPDFEDMSLGAFLDIDSLLNEGVEKSLHKIMAILYRPVKMRWRGRYEVKDYIKEKKYKTKERADLFFHEMSYKRALLTAFFLLNSIEANSTRSID